MESLKWLLTAWGGVSALCFVGSMVFLAYSMRRAEPCAVATGMPAGARWEAPVYLANTRLSAGELTLPSPQRECAELALGPVTDADAEATARLLLTACKGATAAWEALKPVREALAESSAPPLVQREVLTLLERYSAEVSALNRSTGCWLAWLELRRGYNNRDSIDRVHSK